MTDYAKKRFLVIDDQPQARDALRTVAQTLGAFAVEFASNYQDAIYRIRNNAPDIILCDYMLGEGRSGQQLLEELRRFKLLLDETIFMMVTGEQSYEQVVSAVELVPDDYIIKPFSPDKLLLRLERIVAKKNFLPTITSKSVKRNSAWPLPCLSRSATVKAVGPTALKSSANKPKYCSPAATRTPLKSHIATFWKATISLGPRRCCPRPAQAKSPDRGPRGD
jgi:DNA-binding response OmpR family regulator